MLVEICNLTIYPLAKYVFVVRKFSSLVNEDCKSSGIKVGITNPDQPQILTNKKRDVNFTSLFRGLIV